MPSVHIRDYLFARWVKKTGEEAPVDFSVFVNKCVERCLEEDE